MNRITFFQHLLRCQEKKFRRLIRQFIYDKWQSVKEEAQKKLYDGIIELEKRMAKERRIDAGILQDEIERKLKRDAKMYYVECLKKFNNLQKSKLKAILRVMTLFEIEHNQQIADYARNEFSRLDKIMEIHYVTIFKNNLKTKKLAKKLNENLNSKMELNNNLHQRIIINQAMTQELLKQMIITLNDFIKEKGLNIPLLSEFNKNYFVEIIEKKLECKNIDFSSLLLTKLEGKQECNQIRNEESDDSLKKNLLEKKSSSIEEIIEMLLENVIPSPPSRNAIGVNEEKSQFFNIEDEELLAQEGIEERGEKEMFFKLDGEELKVPINLTPTEFVKQRIEIINNIIKRNKHILVTMFQ